MVSTTNTPTVVSWKFFVSCLNSRGTCYLTEVRLPHLLVATQILGRPAGNDAPLHKHVAVMRNSERLMHVLLDQKHRYATIVDALDDVERLLHEQRRQAERRLVDQQQLVGSSRVDLQACKLEYSIVSPK